MNKQRKVLITITYNELGIITDTKAEEVPQPNLQPACNQLATDICVGDTISRQAAIDAVDSETVSTNPEHFKSSEKFIKFMDDDDIASFGRWQWANGFNTALTATTIQLKKLPPAQSEPQWVPVSERLPEESEYYIITANDGVGHRTTFAKFQKKAKSWDLTGARSYWRVIAWMPLPTPYRKGAAT